MAISDKKLLEDLGMSQSDVGHLIGTSRETINAGVKRDETFFNTSRLLLLFGGLRAKGDTRDNVVASLLKDLGVDVKGGVNDILDLEINDRHRKLISNNKSLKEFLRGVVSELVRTKCEEFEGLLKR